MTVPDSRVRRSPRRVIAALLVGLMVGGAVTVVAGSAFDRAGTEIGVGSWGLLNGGLVFLVTFGLVLTGSGRTGDRRVGAFVLAVPAALVATVMCPLVVRMWVPPWSPEGLWMWPLAILSTVTALLATRRALRRELAVVAPGLVAFGAWVTILIFRIPPLAEWGAGYWITAVVATLVTAVLVRRDAVARP